MLVDDVGILVCPETHHPLHWQGTNLEGVLQDGVLVCAETGEAWQVADCLPRLMRDLPMDATRARLLQMHDSAPRLHDPLLRLLLPALGSSTEGAHRNTALERLDLHTGLGARPRVLEVGVGVGGSLPLLARRLAGHEQAQLWGVDASIGMLTEARRRLERHTSGPLSQVRLLLADSAKLPFRDGTFDRVLHLGGLAGFADPAGALTEMARVARSGAPIVVVQASPASGAPAGPAATLARRWLPPAPDTDLAALAPAGATAVQVERLDPLFVALRFRAP